jgi:predicted nucleic acid-binding protein
MATVSSVSIDPDLLDTLDDGEAAAIALAVATNARAFLIDDRAGRRVARSLNLPVIGTLGVLLAAKQRALVPAIGPVIDLLLAQGRHISPNLRAKVLRDANETTEA